METHIQNRRCHSNRGNPLRNHKRMNNRAYYLWFELIMASYIVKDMTRSNRDRLNLNKDNRNN